VRSLAAASETQNLSTKSRQHHASRPTFAGPRADERYGDGQIQNERRGSSRWRRTPFRLALGPDAVEAIRTKHAVLRSELERWEAVARATTLGTVQRS